MNKHNSFVVYFKFYFLFTSQKALYLSRSARSIGYAALRWLDVTAYVISKKDVK